MFKGNGGQSPLRIEFKCVLSYAARFFFIGNFQHFPEEYTILPFTLRQFVTKYKTPSSSVINRIFIFNLLPLHHYDYLTLVRCFSSSSFKTKFSTKSRFYIMYYSIFLKRIQGYIIENMHF